MVNKGTVSFVGLKGPRVQQGTMDCPRNIGVYLYKEVCENVAGVLGFDHFGVISIAYLGLYWGYLGLY